jgi:glyoxylase-like metal-dependent hydrolase (beta-lactamase superfamily II)
MPTPPRFVSLVGVRLRSLASVRSLVIAVSPLFAACETPPPAVAPPPAPPPAAASYLPSAAPAAIVSAAPAASASAASPAPAEDRFANVTIQVEKVAGTVYMLQGAGGNIGVSIGDDGIVLVDDEFAPLAPKIKAALRSITDRPIKVVLNTHWHGDHTGSNAVFGAEAPIVAHENVRKRLILGAPGRTVGDKTLDPIPPAPKVALPIITFEQEAAVHLNGEDIRAIHFPSGHTDGDVVVYFTQSNVVHMGDDFVTYGFPFVDAASGGSIKGLIGAIDKVVAQLPPDVKIIPGHGKVSTADDMKKLSVVLKDCVKLVDAEVKKKRTLEQVLASKPLAKYDDLGKAFIKTDMFVEALYKELTAAPAPAVGKAPIPH